MGRKAWEELFVYVFLQTPVSIGALHNLLVSYLPTEDGQAELTLVVGIGRWFTNLLMVNCPSV